jgi:hypothetical protein
MTAADAGREVGINTRTAQNYVQTYKKDVEERVPLPHISRNRGNRKLFQDHTLFLIAFFEEDAGRTLTEAQQALCKQFPDMGGISISGLQKHVKVHCQLSLKKLHLFQPRATLS